jgi:hypothetical protein
MPMPFMGKEVLFIVNGTTETSYNAVKSFQALPVSGPTGGITSVVFAARGGFVGATDRAIPVRHKEGSAAGARQRQGVVGRAVPQFSSL